MILGFGYCDFVPVQQKNKEAETTLLIRFKSDWSVYLVKPTWRIVYDSLRKSLKYGVFALGTSRIFVNWSMFRSTYDCVRW